ncbi:MAG TPA: LPXTG cell wall anchor domain-containing protein [Solirubrobacterales bacterium]|nr:LPXTG cell wall anchor domain-containing protein [Solirubrobacterales bacterium]
MSLVGSLLLVGASTAMLATAPAGAQVASASANYNGYSTGTAVHVDALTVGQTTVADTELAFSGASVASQGSGAITQGQGAPNGAIVNEMGINVQPQLPNTTLDSHLQGDRSYARGSGLEIGALTTLDPGVDANQLLLAQRAYASAPPSVGPITNEVGPIKIPPAAYASLVRGQATARFNADGTCIAGEEISNGLGYVADAQLLDLSGTDTGANNPFAGAAAAVDAADPQRSVSQSRSFTKLVPQTDSQGNKVGDNFGLLSETRMTIAPVTILQNTPAPITIEVLGEWDLRTVATGIPGQAYVTYGPANASPSTPVVRITGAGLNTELTLQQLLGQQGLVIDVPGIATIAVGEDPRAIGGNATSTPTSGGDGTTVSAAVDVVRVQLLDTSPLPNPLGVLDLRIGHMESRAQVPAGGVKCSIPVTKTADKTTVHPGETFTYNITVTNPFADCDLTNVKVVDTITTSSGVKYTITGTTPSGTVSGNTVTFGDIGPIGPHASKSATISVNIPTSSKGGTFTNNATATGSCATGSAQGGAKITVPISGSVTVTVPTVSGQLPATGVEQLPRTGSNGTAMAFTGLALLASAFGIRRVRRALK